MLPLNLSYRRTFLREHVEAHISSSPNESLHVGPNWNGRKNDNDPAGDILALLELRQSIYQHWWMAWHQRGHVIAEVDAANIRRRLIELTSPEAFFYGYSGLNLCIPVRIREQLTDGRETRGGRVFNDLSHLLCNFLRPIPPRAVSESSVSIDDSDSSMSQQGSQGSPGSQPVKDRSHILLTTRTGAGKTVACWKAFYDCLFSDTAVSEYVPCWLRMPAGSILDTLLRRGWPEEFPAEVRQAGDVGIDRHTCNDRRLVVLLAMTLTLLHPDADGEQVRQAAACVSQNLTHGPPLLLFVDLNHVPVQTRAALASSIAAFHASGPSTEGPLSWSRHRIVIAYRTTLVASAGLDSDPVMRVLCQPTVARRYDLEPLHEQQAEVYLRNVRAFEMELYRQLESFFHPDDYREFPVWRGAFPATPSGADGSFASGRSSVESEDSWFHPERWQTAVHEECRLLRDLIKRTQRDRESLISTPLLMHWVASIDHQRLQAVENVTHLYHEVVWQHLRRFRQQTDMAQEPSVHTDGSGESLAITALTRIALIMLQTNDLRMMRRKVCSLLDIPVPSEQLSELGADDNFWTRKAVDLPAGTAPAAAPVRSVSYYSACFDDRQTAAVLRCGLLRESDQQVAFLHDSLVYYFAGVLGLLHYRGPEVAHELAIVPDSWSEKAAARITSQPAQWLLAAEFLGGALVPMQGLDSPFDARLDVTATGRSKWDLPSHRVLAVEKLVYHSLLATPHPSLPGLLLRLLRGFGHESDNVVLRALKLVLVRQGRIDLEPPPQTSESTESEENKNPFKFIPAFPPEQLAQDVFNFLYWIEKEPGPCHEFACRLLEPLRKTGRKWLRQIHGTRPDLTQTVRLHQRNVTAVTALSNGEILTAGDDGNIFRWEPSSGRVENLVRHYGGIRRLLVDSVGGVIYQRDSSRLLRWDPQSQDTEELINGNDQFVDVVLSPNRRTLFAAQKYGRIVGVELTSDRTNGYDPWNPQGIVLHSIVESIDQLIAYQVFQDNPEGTAEQQRSRSTSGASPVIDAVAIVVKSEGRILSWCLDQQLAVDLFQAPEDHEIAEAVLDQDGNLLVRIVHKDSRDSVGIFQVLLRHRETNAAEHQLVANPADSGPLAEFSIQNHPVMFRHVTSKQGKSIREVYRWEGLQDDGQAAWLHIASLTNGFEPVGALPDGQLILRKGSYIATAHQEPLRRTHLFFYDPSDQHDHLLTSHLQNITCWTTDATGQVVSADTFGFVKRSVVDQAFGQAQPRLELSHRGLVISTTCQFARCGNDWKVTGYGPESDSSFAFRLKSRPLFLKASSDGQLCVLDASGTMHLLNPDTMQQATGPSAGTKYKLEDLEDAVLSASGNLVYSTTSILSDHNFYRLNIFNAHCEQLRFKDLHEPKFAVDASGNVLFSSSFKTLFWPLSSLTAQDVSVRIGASSPLVSGADGSWFFANDEGIIRFDRDSTLLRWRPDGGQETEKVCQHSAPIGAIATSEDGRLVISADADASLSGPLANTRSQYRATRIAVHASRRNAAAGTWASEVLFEFRAEVPAVGVTREGHAFAASIDGSLQFAFASGEKMRIETGNVIGCTVADPARPLIAFAAHEQEEITVFAIEPDAAGCSTLLPFRRDQHGEFFHRQLEHQIRQNAPAERIERFALKSAQHFEARTWSSSQILEALQPTAPFAQQSAVLLNVEAAFTVVQSDSATAREFQERLIRLMGSDYNGLLRQRIRGWALDGCDKLGMMMIEPLLALFDEQSRRGCINMLTALQLIASQDQRVDRLIQATILKPPDPDLPHNLREVREQTFQWFLERQWGLITQLTNRGHLGAASTCFRRWQQLAAMHRSENLPSQIRHNMRQALTVLASAHAGSGELSEAIQWLNECHELTPPADSAEYSVQLTRSEATVISAVAEAAGMEFIRSEHPKTLISSIDKYLDDKDQDLETPWWIRNFHAVSHEFTGLLLKLNRLADGWAWMQHATWYFDLALAAFSGREQAHRDAAYRARELAEQFSKAKLPDTALKVAEFANDCLDRHLAAGGDDYGYCAEKLADLIHRIHAELAACAWDQGEEDRAFGHWESSWLSLMKLPAYDPEDLVRKIQASMVSGVKRLDDPRLLDVMVRLSQREMSTPLPALGDFYRCVRCRIQIEILETWDEDEAKIRLPDAQRLLAEYSGFDSSQLRESELQHFVYSLEQMCADETLFRGAFHLVNCVLTRFALLIGHIARSRSRLLPDDFNSLLEEAESLWRTAPADRWHLCRLGDLVLEIELAISTATENSQISRAEGLLPWYERLSQLRLDAAGTIEDLDEDDRTRTYQSSKALSLARIAIELSSGDARDHWQRATQYIVEAESIVSGEKEPNDELIKLLSEARANLLAKELRDLPWNDALKSVEKIDYPPYQHWALHHLGLHLAASGDIDHACEVLRRMSELEGQGRLSKTPDQWAEQAELQAGIAAAALAVGQPLLFEQMNFSFEASLLEAKCDEEWLSDRLMEAAFRCRRLLANASIQSREVLKVLITVTRGLRSVRQHSQASWRGESWYDLHGWLIDVCLELLQRGPWGRRLARLLTDWQVEQLSLIEEQGPREDRVALVAFLYGVLDAITEQRELLGQIESEVMRNYSAPILAACEAAEGDFARAWQTLEDVGQRADEMDPDHKNSWLRGLIPLGRVVAAARQAMKEPQVVRDWIGTMKSARERHDAAAHTGFYCCRAGRAADGLEFFEDSIGLLVEIRDEMQHQQALRLSATFMRAAAVDLMDLGDETSAARIASRIPDSLIQDEAFWLMSTVKEQQLRVAVEPEVMHPWFVLCEADTSSLPSAEIYELLPADSPLRDRILSFEGSEFDSKELAHLWLDLDFAVLESWLRPIVRS